MLLLYHVPGDECFGQSRPPLPGQSVAWRLSKVPQAFSCHSTMRAQESCCAGVCRLTRSPMILPGLTLCHPRARRQRQEDATLPAFMDCFPTSSSPSDPRIHLHPTARGGILTYKSDFSLFLSLTHTPVSSLSSVALSVQLRPLSWLPYIWGSFPIPSPHILCSSWKKLFAASPTPRRHPCPMS